MALDRPTTSELTASVMASVQRCLAAARAIAAIGGTIPYTRKELPWSLLPSILTAVIVLSFNLLRTPGADSADEDLEAILCLLKLFDAMDEADKMTYLAYLQMSNVWTQARITRNRVKTRKYRKKDSPLTVVAILRRHGMILAQCILKLIGAALSRRLIPNRVAQNG
ncbi:Fungal-trans domain-containing protein [Fusarium keratoplasticum]|uniref:Fungal-trans domain-containing protein n=1 Tax=Fusarium keratoplasticum TaxID=1328300 RepID=A0ACC0QGG7_9HYPO|nr:Fungal-trans domain-containing protein [Fusarium keratoplasticum]KAI8654619.1 Fungal-trans domain-containing protein [Fusarium keratoplasticum]